MKTVETCGTAGPDKVLRLNIPVEKAGRMYRVVVVLEEATAAGQSTEAGRGWPPGFIESTAGSIQDETFVRPEQGEFEKRLDFE